jgi:tetratricopeptide (TPR) repeat protein
MSEPKPPWLVAGVITPARHTPVNKAVKLCRIGPPKGLDLMQALDELLARWRKNPDPESTLALCAHLGTSHQAELMREVANTAEAWHRENHSVMLSVGRMYLDAGLLAEAQAALIQAGKLEPNDAEAYRYLGEVLLRRGDAVRAEKTLARAIHTGGDTPETRLWHERSVLYVPLQKRQSLAAVADEVARTVPLHSSIPAPALSPFERRDPDGPSGAPRVARRSRPPLAPARPAGRRRSQAPGASRRRGSTPPPAGPDHAAKSAPLDTLLMGRSPVPVPILHNPVHPPSPFVPSESHAPRPARAPRGAAVAPGARGAAAASPGIMLSGVASATQGQAPRAQTRPPLTDLLRRSSEGLLRELESVTDTQPDSEPLPGDLFRDTFSADEQPDTVDTALAALVPVAEEPPLPAPEHAGAPPVPAPASQFTPSTADVASGPSSLSAQTVLLELARVGLYEKDSAVIPAWEAAPRPAPRRVWVMAGALVAAAALGVGGYRYAIGVQSERLAQAQVLGMRLASALDSGSPTQLRASEPDFQRLFELDSRGREAALLWLENRVLQTLLENPPTSGIESALQRARTVGIEETRLIFARVASSLAAGDLPGASATIAEWDARAKGEPYYQLLAGLTFERAGNPEALDRYRAAVALQPDLKLAHVLTARLALLSLGPVPAKSLVEIATAQLGPGAAADVLRGLEWAASPYLDGKVPTLPTGDALADLSPLMLDTLSAVLAVQAQREGRLEDSMAAFKRALGAGATPAMAAWIGYQALDAGDVEIARLSALKAMQLSAMHTTSHPLTARIALAEGRLDQAREAARGFDPSSRDAVLIEAVSAYENLQGRQALQLVSSLPVDPAIASTLEALRESDKAISLASRPKDERLVQLASEQRLWGAVVAADLALDSGRLELAERIQRARGWDPRVPAYALRSMRLRRYLGQGAAALELVPVLSDRKQATPRALAELVLTLVGEGRAAAASTTLADMQAASGTLAPWLEAIVEAARGRQPNAAKTLAGLEPPAKSQPALEQVVALRALTAVKDRRAKAYYGQLDRRFRGHPEVLAAGQQLGLVKAK